ncbi:MAG TPA: fluoride efflux transporter CrcB [Actinomycetes bacterium]
MTALLVLLGAAVGAPSRWLLDQAVQSRHRGVFPYGTMLINVAGSLLLGLLLGAQAYGPAGPHLVSLAGTGFCGGFTTFSTFGYETVRLAEQGDRRAAVANTVGSLALGLLAAFAGWYLAKALWT